MSWFSNVNVDDLPDNPNELPNNTYKFRVTSAEIKPTKSGDKTGITFKYQIVEGPYSNFFPLSDWTRVPDSNTKSDEIERMLMYLKMRLVAFGFTMDEIQKFDEKSVDKCVGREFYGTTSCKKTKDNQGNERTQISVVKFDPIGEGSNTEVDFPDLDESPF